MRRLIAGLVLLADAAAGSHDALLSELDAIRLDAHVPALGLVLVDGSQVDVLTLGVADRQSGAPFRPDDLIRIGSITKLFTGIGLLLAEGRGLIDLDAPIPSLVESSPYENPWASQRTVSIAMLLEHTAGLLDLSPREFDYPEPLSLPDALAVAPSSRRLAWPPAMHSSYSNTGAGIAAWVFEQHTGQDFERWVDDQVFSPLAMDSATFQPSPGLITGYDTDGQTPIPYWHQLYRPFGAVNVRLDEMAAVVQMLIAEGRHGASAVLTPEQVHRLETPQTTLAARSGLAHGYGFGNYAYTHKGHVLHGHGGDADGYLSFLGYNREAGRGYFVVITAFQNRTLRRLREVIEHWVVAALEPSFQPPVPLPMSRLARLGGHYVESTRRFDGQPSTLEVIHRDGRLWLRRDGRTEVLLPITDQHFRRRWEPIATIAFIEADDTLYLQGPFGNYQRRD